MSWKVKVFFIAAAVVLACVWFFGADSAGSAEDSADAPTSSSDSAGKSVRAERRKLRARSKASSRPTKKGLPRKRLVRVEDEFDDPEHPYSAEDKQIALRLQDALDAYGGGGGPARKDLLSWAAKAAASENPVVRKRAIDAYSWVGKDALAELTPLMADPDSEVAEEAIDSVENALTDIGDQEELFTLSASYLGTFSANEDAITMLSGIMEGAAMQIVEPDDPDNAAHVARAAQNRFDVVDALTQMIDAGGKVAEAAKESFETITSQDWISADEAKLWAEDPENYEPPE